MDFNDKAQFAAGKFSKKQPGISSPVKKSLYRIAILNNIGWIHLKEKTVKIEKPVLLLIGPEVSIDIQTTADSNIDLYCMFNRQYIQQKELLYLLDMVEDIILCPEPEQTEMIERIFGWMIREINSCYIFKYDLLVNHLSLLLHEVWKYLSNCYDPYPDHLLISYQ